MKIKRYTAPSMRAALALVRAEQGPDAVILSSRRGDDGIEVIAAVDYDEALFKHMAPQRPAPPAVPFAPAAAPVVPPAALGATAPAATPAPAARVVVTPPAAPRPAANPRPTAAPRAPAVDAVRAPARATVNASPSYDAMQRELQDLRRLLETGLAGMTWSDKRLREPLQARVLEELAAMDIAPDVALALAA